MAVTKLIDRAPPALSGDDARDLRAMRDYLAYLREQMNFNLSLIARQHTTEEE